MIRLLPLPGVFQPHSDSWLLARCLEQEPIGPGTAVLDLCTGSGLLAVIAATRGASVVAIDTSTSAVLSARLNATLNGVALQAVRGDMFSPLDGRRFDLIASNPPYLPSQTGALPSRGMSRAWEGGARGREFIERICAEAPRHLAPGGALLLVHSSVCGEHETIDALSRHGLRTEVVARRRGPLGIRLRERAEWLSERGLLTGDDQEDIIVFRGHAAGA